MKPPSSSIARAKPKCWLRWCAWLTGKHWNSMRSWAIARGSCRPTWFPTSSCPSPSCRVAHEGRPTTTQCSIWCSPGATTSAGSSTRAAEQASLTGPDQRGRSGVQHNDVGEGEVMQNEDMDDWRWWRQILVRGSGFPANGVLRLGNEALARKADTLVNADRRSEEWRAFCEEFCEATVRQAIELQSIASRDDFLRAVTWQNHRLMDGAIRPFLRWDPTNEQRNQN